jgi:Poly(ADP-ribose) polymerase and DNA-Ligase Zn-finger region
MRVVPDSIHAAPSGRAKCRGCGRAIAKGELRFGETGPNSYGEGEATSWFHLPCAALMRPEKLLPVLEQHAEPAPEREWLEQAARVGLEHRRLPRLTRVERASSGRAHCRSCRELIAKGEWRFALQMFEEGRPNPIGTIHVSCAEAYFGTTDVVARARRLTPELSDADAADLAKALAVQRPGLAKTQGAESDEAALTGSGDD